MLKIILNLIQLFTIMEPAQNLYMYSCILKQSKQIGMSRDRKDERLVRREENKTKNDCTNNGLLNKHKSPCAYFHNKIIMGENSLSI